MQAFKTVRGIMAVLDRANVDTDQIIPKQFLKSIKRTGFGESLFFDWRCRPDGSPDPAFVLNRPPYDRATILVAGNNFGCGSSREHAVWAVMQAGFAVVIAPRLTRGGHVVRGFADIFAGNAVKNGLLTVELAAEEVAEIVTLAERFPGLEATVDLDEQRVVLHLPEELAFHFELDPAAKQHLVHGLDEIGQTLKHAAAITRFDAGHQTWIA